MKIELDYSFTLQFDSPVKEHHFALRITPRDTPYYNICTFETNDRLWHTQDGFGNILSFGDIKEPHTIFDIKANAIIDFIAPYGELDTGLSPALFSEETPLTQYSPKVANLLLKLKLPNNKEDLIDYLIAWIKENFEYQRGITAFDSTIDTLLECNKGVCQDFAHLAIAILRHHGIPCRYISGFVLGEGESHAWIEYFDGTSWRGVDPTHHIIIDTEPYIKIAHGRDAFDVAMNRGVFRGTSTHIMSIQAIIKGEQ